MLCFREIEQHNLQQLKQVVKRLLDTAVKVTEGRSKLHSLYYEWSNGSTKTIESLLQIRKEILRHNLNSNIASLTGTSTAIVGSICSIIGVTFAIPTGGLSLALTAGGALAALLGGVVSERSKITKNVLSKQLCEEAKRVFSENISVTKSLEEEREAYFDLLNQFKNELEELQSMDVLQALAHLSRIEDIFSRDLELEDAVMNSLPPSSTEMENMLPEEKKSLFETIKEYVLRQLKLIKEDGSLSQLWGYIKAEIKREPKNFVSRCFQVVGGATVSISTAAKILKDAFQGISIAPRTALGVVNGIFVIFGIVDLVTTSVNVYSSSVSRETEELLKTTENLKKYREDVVEIMAVIFGWNI